MTKPIPSADLADFQQRAFLDAVELFDLSAKFAWQQAEHSLETLNEIGSEACKLWLGVLTGHTGESRTSH
jgi:hypothetical protein